MRRVVFRMGYRIPTTTSSQSQSLIPSSLYSFHGPRLLASLTSLSFLRFSFSKFFGLRSTVTPRSLLTCCHLDDEDTPWRLKLCALTRQLERCRNPAPPFRRRFDFCRRIRRASLPECVAGVSQMSRVRHCCSPRVSVLNIVHPLPRDSDLSLTSFFLGGDESYCQQGNLHDRTKCYSPIVISYPPSISNLHI
jgi:hypothetical protein